jgi:hypothetical protein
MVNRSIAQRLLGEEADEDGSWIIVYDFIKQKPNPNFWVNLRRISDQRGGRLIQYSVYRTESHDEAQAVRRLVNHYGGESRMFRCVETNI